MFPLGISAATAVLVARSVGAQDIGAVTQAFRMGLTLAMGVLVALSLVVLAMPETVARAYTSDPGLVAVVSGALLLSCLFFVADGAQAVAAHALRARGDIWWPTRMHIVSYIALMLPLAWWLGIRQGHGLDGIVWAVIAASLVSAVALVWRFRALGTFMKAGDH
jgi:MATE family multidrug resistance protein